MIAQEISFLLTSGFPGLVDIVQHSLEMKNIQCGECRKRKLVLNHIGQR